MSTKKKKRKRNLTSKEPELNFIEAAHLEVAHSALVAQYGVCSGRLKTMTERSIYSHNPYKHFPDQHHLCAYPSLNRHSFHPSST
jgi:hypothetical protein